jgi:hypothetical protein
VSFGAPRAGVVVRLPRLRASARAAPARHGRLGRERGREPIMRGNIAIVREALSRLPNVSRTWFEWSWEDAMWVKTLVIEVEFDTDPNSERFNQSVLDAIENTVIGVLTDDTTLIVSYLKVVPKAAH